MKKVTINQNVKNYSVSVNETTKNYRVKIQQNIITKKIEIAQLGKPGLKGDSAYQTWLNLGNIGSEQDFLNSLNNTLDGGIIF